MLGNGGGAAAVEPEGFARFGRYRNKAFAAAGVGQLNNVCGGGLYGVFVVRHDVGQQHHFGAAFARRFGGIAHGAHIAPIEVFQTGQAHAVVAEHIVTDFHDRRGGVGHGAKKFQTHGAGVLGHGVQHKGHAGDDAVGAFFLYARHAGEEFVGNVFAQTHFAKAMAIDGQPLGFGDGAAVGFEGVYIKKRGGFVVDFAEIVVYTLDFEPFALWVHHFPPSQIVQRRAPQHRFFAACIHGHIAAHAAGIGGSGVYRKHQFGGAGGFFYPPRDHPGAAVNHRMGAFQPGQGHVFDAVVAVELFGVNHGAHGVQRHGTAGIAGATAARDDGEL